MTTNRLSRIWESLSRGTYKMKRNKGYVKDNRWLWIGLAITALTIAGFLNEGRPL